MKAIANRFWRYPYGQWTPRWWYYFVPYPGGDEDGRRTLVFHVPPIGFIVWAYRTCHCQECDQARLWTQAREEV